MFLLLSKLPCALKQWYQAHVYDIARDGAEENSKLCNILLHAGILSATVTLYTPTLFVKYGL